MGEFVINLQDIRDRARQHIEQGAVTANYPANREVIVNLLNEALATELVCVLRYRRHYEMANGINSEAVSQEFLKHANEEQEHADRLADRITQLNGAPDYNPSTLAQRSHTEYVECSNLLDMIKENLVAERIAIETYGEIIRYIGDTDPTTRRILEDILAKEEEHAEEMSNLLGSIDPAKCA
jgi:bacterioferritin